jgi:hypothetical protein
LPSQYHRAVVVKPGDEIGHGVDDEGDEKIRHHDAEKKQ